MTIARSSINRFPDRENPVNSACGWSTKRSENLIDSLEHSSGATPAAQVAAEVSELGSIGALARPISSRLAALSLDRSPLFRDRDKYEVMRLRALMLATLAKVGVSRDSIPLLADQLANSDQPPVLAAAARAVGMLGPSAGWAVPYLARILGPGAMDEPIALDRYDQRYAPAEAITNMRLEAVRALARIGSGAREQIPVLRSLLADQPPGNEDSQLCQEIASALRILEPAEVNQSLGTR